MASESQEHQFLTRRELAARWRCTHHAVDNQASRGEGPPYVILGGRALYLLSDVEKYERAHTVDPGAQCSSHEKVRLSAEPNTRRRSPRRLCDDFTKALRRSIDGEPHADRLDIADAEELRRVLPKGGRA